MQKKCSEYAKLLLKIDSRICDICVSVSPNGKKAIIIGTKKYKNTWMLK